MKKILAIFLLLISSTAISEDTGKVAYVSFASKVANTLWPGKVQFRIEGGFSEPNCNTTYAAIASEDTHLVSLLLTAKAQDKELEVHLDSTNKYYSDRCLVSYLVVN